MSRKRQTDDEPEVLEIESPIAFAVLKDLTQAIKQRDSAEREVEQLKKSAPAWHARPTSPGWWLHWKQGEMFYAQDAADESWESHGAVYGPIPEPPEMPT